MHLAAPNKELESLKAAELLQRRRTSASVDEIRDLFSALQELVPGASSYPSHGHPPVDSPENKTAGDSSNCSSPVARRKLFGNASAETSNSTPRVKRALPVPPGSPSYLRKFNSRMIQALDINANHSPKKDKRSPNLGRRGSSGEVLLGMHLNQNGHLPNMETRDSSGEVFLSVRTNQSKPLSPLVRSRGASSSDTNTKPASCRSTLEKVGAIITADRLSKRGSEGGFLSTNTSNYREKPSPLLLARRGSSGDVVTMETKKKTRPQSPLTSQRSNSLWDVPGPTEPSADRLSPRRGSLANALTKFSTNFKWKKHAKSAEQPTKPELEGENHDIELLRALHELSAGTPNTESDSPCESELRSRSGSEVQSPVPVQRESLDQLEAYFSEKLRDVTKAKASKTPSERSSESDVPHSDKEDNDSKRSGTEASSAKQSLVKGFADDIIDVVDHFTIPKSSSDPELKLTQLKEGREEFANQVNRKLQQWLTKAVALSIQEGIASTVEDTSGSEDSKDDCLESDDSDSNKSRRTKVKLKRNILSKLSFLRRGNKQRMKFKHRRTRSLHDIAFPFENEYHFDDNEDEPLKNSAKSEQLAQTSRRPSVSRSKSMHEVARGLGRGGREMETVANPEGTHVTDTVPDGPTIQWPHAVTGSSNENCDTRTSSMETSPTTALSLTNLEVCTIATSLQNMECNTANPVPQKRRLFCFPTNHPIFYEPDNEKPAAGAVAQRSLRHEKQLLPNKNEIFYSDTHVHCKVKKAPSEPQQFKNTRTKFVSGTPSIADVSGQRNKAVELFYQGSSSDSTSLRRFASHDSFLDVRDLQHGSKSEVRGVRPHGKTTPANNAFERRLVNDAANSKGGKNKTSVDIPDVRVKKS